MIKEHIRNWDARVSAAIKAEAEADKRSSGGSTEIDSARSESTSYLMAEINEMKKEKVPRHPFRMVQKALALKRIRDAEAFRFFGNEGNEDDMRPSPNLLRKLPYKT